MEFESSPEIPLTGGHMNDVVRVGDTVRRRLGPHSAAVHALLKHLRRKGIGEVPEVLGIDERGREVLRYFEGVPALSEDPAVLWSDDTLAAAGRLLRRFHNAQAGLELAPDVEWSLIGREPGGYQEVLCHNDFTPYNSICRDGRIVGMIDFDLVAPGSRAWDLAWTAVNWIPLFDPSDHPRERPDPPESGRRLRLLCEAYGFEDRETLVSTMLHRMEHSAMVGAQRLAAGDPWAVRTADHRPFWARAQAFIEANADELVR